jgi:arylsulfatase A-like enzyme
VKSIKRIFLITVDCLRADHVGCIGGRGLTPYIDELARKSVVFTRAFSNGPGTNQSFPAILTSTYFFMHDGMRLLPYYTTLAEFSD